MPWWVCRWESTCSAWPREPVEPASERRCAWGHWTAAGRAAATAGWRAGTMVASTAATTAGGMAGLSDIQTAASMVASSVALMADLWGH